MQFLHFQLFLIYLLNFLFLNYSYYSVINALGNAHACEYCKVAPGSNIVMSSHLRISLLII